MSPPSLNTVLKIALSLVPTGGRTGSKLQKIRLVTDHQFKNTIFNELEEFKSKMKGHERKDLSTGVTLFRDGLASLYQTLNDTLPAEEIKPGNLFGALETAATVAFGGLDPLSQYLENMRLWDLGSTQKQNLENAKLKFKVAKEKAERSLKNVGLSTSDRISAAKLCVMATILHRVEEPRAACEECRSCLKEIHAVPDVKEAFSGHFKKGLKSFFKKQQYADVLASVCHLNQVVFNFTLAVGGKVAGWPCVDIGQRIIRPVADAKVGQMLHDMNLGHYDVQLSFGHGRKSSDEKLRGPEDLTFSREGLCIVADLNSHQVKVFSESRVFMYPFALPMEHNHIFLPVSVATDSTDNVYVLANLKTRGGGKDWRGVVIFDKHGNIANKIPLKHMFVGWSFSITKNNKMFIVGLQQTRLSSWQEIQVYNFNGKLLESFGKDHLIDAAFLTTALLGDLTHVIITDFGGQCVHIFDEHGVLVRQFNTEGSLTNAGGLGFSPLDHKIVVATVSTHLHSGQVELYDTNGTLHHKVTLDTQRDPILKGVSVMSNGLVAVIDKTQQRVLLI